MESADKVSKDFFEAEEKFIVKSERLSKMIKEKKTQHKYKDIQRELLQCVRRMELELKIVQNFRTSKEFKRLKQHKKSYSDIEELVNLAFLDFDTEDNFGHIGGDETFGLLGAAPPRSHKTNTLLNIKRLGESVFSVAKDVNSRLNKDSEGLKNAIDMNNEIGRNLSMASHLISGISRSEFMQKLTLFLIIVILGIVDALLFYFKVIA